MRIAANRNGCVVKVRYSYTLRIFDPGGTVKNIFMALLMLGACVVATLFGAAVYFGITFGLLNSLFGLGSAKVGTAIVATAGALGFPVGCAVFGMLCWSRLVREDGRPDRVARTIALIVVLPVAIIPLVYLGGPALLAVAAFKGLGFLAVAGFLGLTGWIEERTRKRS